jgi:hypothetical protein
MASILQMIQSNDMLKIAIILLGVYFYIKYTKEPLENVSAFPAKGIYENLDNIEEKVLVQGDLSNTQAMAPSSDEQQFHMDGVVAGKDQLHAADLLPKYDDANEFAKQNPVSNLLKEQNFLISGYHVGINTVMQSNKIPYHDLRSVPPIPKQSVSPFMNSSYETPMGANRRQMEILN